MARKRRTRHHPNRTFLWVTLLLAIGVLFVAWWLWSCLYNVSPEFNFVLIRKNGNPLKLLNGETLHLHPRDRLKILKISTNICFNRGVRLVARGIDVNALRLEEMVVAALLPGRDIFNQYKFRVSIKQFNHEMAHMALVVEPTIEDWLDRADRTIDKNRRLALLERALELIPQDRRIRDRLIDEYKSQKKWQKAALMLEQMIRENPDPDLLYDLLQVYESTPNTDGVISVLRRLIKVSPDDAEIRLQLASVLERKGRLKDAIREYQRLLKKLGKTDRLPVYKTLGYLYTKTRQFKRAISNYHKAVELDKKDANLYYNLSVLYERMGQKNKADSFLEKAVTLRSGDIESRLKLAQRLIQKGKPKEAEKHLTAVLKKRPKSLEALLLMINALEKSGNKKKLKGFYYKSLALAPKNETLIYNLGVLEYEAGNLTKSLSHFKKFLKSHPKDAEVHSFLFDIYKRQKKSDLAFAEALTLSKLRPKETGYYAYVFQFLDSHGNYKKMIEIMEGALKSHPKNLDLREYLVIAYLKTGREDTAALQMEEILKRRPKDVTLLLQLAKLKERQGKVQDALGVYKKILVISPRHKKARESYLKLLLQLARLEEKQGKFEEALETYRKILDISPDMEEVEEAYFRLRLKVLPGGS